MNQANQSTQTQSGQRQTGTQGDFVLDNLTYDIITVLHKKAKAIEAYEEYIEDAESNEEVRALLEEIKEQDESHAQRLEQCLSQLLQGSNKGSQSANNGSRGNQNQSSSGRGSSNEADENSSAMRQQ